MANSIYVKLLNVQQTLKATKDLRNSFGNYNYRSCESILESVKPILKENKLVLVLSDELVSINERYYVRATAQLIDIESGDSVENTSYAREEEDKKGMDGSQITGASSSYARKYALNGLFAIDDNKDSDSTNDGVEKMIEKSQLEKLNMYFFTLSNEKQKSMKQYVKDKFGANEFEQLTRAKASALIKALKINEK